MGLTLVPWSDVMVFKISLQFKRVATLPCDVSLLQIVAGFLALIFRKVV